MFDWDTFIASKKRTSKRAYSKRRLCKNCENPVCDTSHSGLCYRCSLNRGRGMAEGSRYKTKFGYVNVRVNGIFVSEHRHVWEQANEKQLPRHWLVHHLNGVKDDNRLENLHAMSKKNHGTHTKLEASQSRVRELEITPRQA